MGAVCGAGYAYRFGAPDLTSGLHKDLYWPVNCFSLFHVKALSFGILVLFDFMVSIYIVVKKEGCCHCFISMISELDDLIEMKLFV